MTKGYVVVGNYGAMGRDSRSGPELFFGCRRGNSSVATVFATRKAAKDAIALTLARRKEEYPNEEPWLRMYVVRLIANGKEGR